MALIHVYPDSDNGYHLDNGADCWWMTLATQRVCSFIGQACWGQTSDGSRPSGGGLEGDMERLPAAFKRGQALKAWHINAILDAIKELRRQMPYHKAKKKRR